MPRNSKELVEKRRQRVAELCLAEKTQAEIAVLLSISESQVSRDVKTKRKEWRELRAADFDNKIDRELAKISLAEKAYWEAWERSKTNYKKKGVKIKGNAKGKSPDYIEQQETEIVKDGDPRFLQGIERCIERRCKLLGLDAPTKTIIEDSSFLNFLMNT